ncbi:MAG: histidine phosphatase family protein [Clostridiales bacterium]|nr:histidine phosphatase family protein [Clostridiales bacterium]
MKIVFIRHGEPDKATVDARGFVGQGRDMAPLTELGIHQAEEVSKSPLLEGSEMILSSPYTRALQTAGIISKNTGIAINVEVDLHEFIPDKTFRVKGEEEDAQLHQDFRRCKGEYPPGEVRKWETVSEIISRTKPVFDRYEALGCRKIIVVAHGGVIRRYSGAANIDYCEACEVDYSCDFKCFGWV